MRDDSNGGCGILPGVAWPTTSNQSDVNRLEAERRNEIVRESPETAR